MSNINHSARLKEVRHLYTRRRECNWWRVLPWMCFQYGLLPSVSVIDCVHLVSDDSKKPGPTTAIVGMVGYDNCETVYNSLLIGIDLISDWSVFCLSSLAVSIVLFNSVSDLLVVWVEYNNLSVSHHICLSCDCNITHTHLHVLYIALTSFTTLVMLLRCPASCVQDSLITSLMSMSSTRSSGGRRPPRTEFAMSHNCG